MSIKKTVREAIARKKKANRVVWLQLFCAGISADLTPDQAKMRADTCLVLYNAKFKKEL